MHPCDTVVNLVHIVIAVFGGCSSLLTVWLAHRRKQADSERRAFEDIMLDHMGLSNEVRDWHRRRVRRGNGK